MFGNYRIASKLHFPSTVLKISSGAKESVYFKVELHIHTSLAHILISFLRHWIPLVLVGEMELSGSSIKSSPQLSTSEGGKEGASPRFSS